MRDCQTVNGAFQFYVVLPSMAQHITTGCRAVFAIDNAVARGVASTLRGSAGHNHVVCVAGQQPRDMHVM